MTDVDREGGSSTTTDVTRPLEVRSARASSVIVQRIPPDASAAFMEWQRGISADAAKCPGYQTTELFPAVGEQEEWVAIIHFDDPQTLQHWLDSAKRAEWVAKLPCKNTDFRLTMLPSGFGGWIAGLNEDGQRLPHWKMFLTVLLGLYPTVFLLSVFLLPHTKRFGLAIAVLIGNAASVSFLEWWGMPVISRALRPWLRANKKEDRNLSVIGLILVLAALGLMTYLFSLVPSQP